jgi:hypothetical protein
LIGWVEMPPNAYGTIEGRRLSSWRSLLLWLCAFSLLVALANRVPHFAQGETSWVRSTPPHITARIMAKDFFLLPPPASGIFTPLRSVPVLRTAKEARPPSPVFLDNRLYTRPPPTA